MKTNRCSFRPVRLVILVCQFGLILRTEAQIPEICVGQQTYRPPRDTDTTVICGTEHMDLSIFLCPVYQALYNESMMVLNMQFNNPECYGEADWTADPPVLKFSFPVNERSISFCKNNWKIIDRVGSGGFSHFSNVQHVNISGSVTSVDPSAGMITFRPPILYKFSCLYPMQYVLDNTELSVSGSSLAIRDNNGTFISTLSMHLYKDEQYQEMLIIPRAGINPKTRIYVTVKATNLTERFNVFLDRCYATASPYPMMSNYYDLFVGCSRDAQTKVELNGVSQEAHFSFEAFRFVEHKYQITSTFYLHCVTRLCEASSCSSLIPKCDSFFSLWKREAQYMSDSTTITSPVIRLAKLSPGVTDGLTTNTPSYNQTEKKYKYNTESPPHSVFDGSSTSFLSRYSINVLAVMICKVIFTICFSD